MLHGSPTRSSAALRDPSHSSLAPSSLLILCLGPTLRKDLEWPEGEEGMGIHVREPLLGVQSGLSCPVPHGGGAWWDPELISGERRESPFLGASLH